MLHVDIVVGAGRAPVEPAGRDLSASRNIGTVHRGEGHAGGCAEFQRARRETVRYHEELYAEAKLGQAGTWLARPHRLLADTLAHVPNDRAVVAYDLGAGVGRHTVPLLERLHGGSIVVAVDLLESALAALRSAVPLEADVALRTRTADLNTFEFEEPADLVFAFSAIEHLPDLASIGRLLARIRVALRPSAWVALGIMADRAEVDREGRARPALLESAISSTEALELIGEAFAGFRVLHQQVRPTQVREQRGDDSYLLTSTLVTWIATADGDQDPAPGI